MEGHYRSEENTEEEEFATSLSSHLLVSAECPAFYDKNILSLCAHIQEIPEIVDEDTRHLVSMVAHQQHAGELQQTDSDAMELPESAYEYFTIQDDVPAFNSSSVSHQLLSLDIDICYKEQPTSRVSHEVNKVEDADEDMLSMLSMRAHIADSLTNEIEIHMVKRDSETIYFKLIEQPSEENTQENEFLISLLVNSDCPVFTKKTFCHCVHIHMKYQMLLMKTPGMLLRCF